MHDRFFSSFLVYVSIGVFYALYSLSVMKSRKNEKRRDYDPMHMEQAVEAVIRGLMKPTEAAAYYRVPRTTINLRVKKRTSSYI